MPRKHDMQIILSLLTYTL